MHDRPGLQIINPVKEPEPDKGSYELFPSDNKSRRPPPDHSKYPFLLRNLSLKLSSAGPISEKLVQPTYQLWMSFPEIGLWVTNRKTEILEKFLDEFFWVNVPCLKSEFSPQE